MRVRGVLVRRLIPIEHLDDAIQTYERLFDQKARLRFDYAEKNLRLAQVGQVLLIGGTDVSLEPFRATSMTFLVEDIEACRSFLPSIGATTIREIQPVPTGRNMLIRHPDGAIVEYVEHDHPDPADDTLSAHS